MSRPWVADLGISVVSGVISAVLVLLMGAVYVEDLVERFRPSTCDNPGDLRQLQAREVALRAPFWDRPDAPDDRPDRHPPEFLLDGNLATMWIPLPVRYDDNIQQPFRSAKGGGTLTMEFLEPSSAQPVTHDVQLVCVVNGLASEPVRNKNWGRVRTVRVESTSSSEQRTGVLQSLSSEEFQNAQELPLPRGDTTGLKVSVVSSYSGQTVFSPDGDMCEQDTPSGGGWELAFSAGCLHGLTRRSGLSELYVYVDD
jgi:hypothetical protein